MSASVLSKVSSQRSWNQALGFWAATRRRAYSSEIVSEEDYHTVQSPYNTYENKGLPPGPIANPGMESIMAALNPNSTNYYYYALGDDGVHHFFSTNSAFQAFLNS